MSETPLWLGYNNGTMDNVALGFCRYAMICLPFSVVGAYCNSLIFVILVFSKTTPRVNIRGYLKGELTYVRSFAIASRLRIELKFSQAHIQH